EILEQAGCIVEVAANGREALDILNQLRRKVEAGENPLLFGAVLMDLQMPVMDGYTATHKIRAMAWPEGNKIPIIAMTAHVSTEEREKCLQAGMNDHVAKPIDVEQLYASLLKWVSPTSPFGRSKVAGHVSSCSESDELLDMTGIDVDSALVRLGGNRNLLDKLIRQLRIDCHQHGNAVHVALAAGDRGAARESAHALKGIAGNVSATNLFETCHALELALAGNNDLDLAPLMAAFDIARLGVMGTTVPIADALIASEYDERIHGTDGNISHLEASRQELNAFLQQLDGLLQKNSMKATDLMPQFHDLCISSGCLEAVSAIETAVEELRFGDALDIVRRMQKRIVDANGEDNE
ncbi:MAG: response regulator, partial [Desulfobulbaceae bacterium]|nr:response regulator [Desulfobulbaceae bacterium]